MLIKFTHPDDKDDIIQDEDEPWRKKKDEYYRRHFFPEKDPVITKFTVSVTPTKRLPFFLLSSIITLFFFVCVGLVFLQILWYAIFKETQLRLESYFPFRQPPQFLQLFHGQGNSLLPT